MDQRTNLLDLDRPRLESFVLGLGERRYRADQLLKWIHYQQVSDFDAMTDLGKAFRARLSEVATMKLPDIRAEQTSADGTVKWLLEVDAGNRIETVFIPDGSRGTLCVSSQVGCPLACSFCSTARQGFNRNLAVSEIIGQVWLARRRLRELRPDESGITNVVMMGMGEPLLNFENVVPAMNLMLDDFAYGLSKRRVTLSTAGIVPALLRLREASPVSLAVSLHAPNDALRDRLVPLNRSYPLDALLAACKTFIDGQHDRQITFEYVMLDGVNDQPEHARELARRLRGIPSKVNLIPFNVFPHAGYRRSPPERIDAFRDILVGAGLVTITRRTRGDDIDAACGQLVGKVDARSERHRRARAGAAAA